MHRLTRIYGLVIVSILIALTQSSWAESTPKYAPDRRVDIHHLTLDVIPDFEGHTLDGKARIEFAPIAHPLTELRLNAADLDVFRVWSDARIKDWTLTDTHVVIAFDPAIPADQKTFVALFYRAQPKMGLYFRTVKNGYPAEDTHVYSQGETHEAQHWYPNYDYPNERFTSEIICRVPQGMTVLSNGKIISETTDNATGLKSVHWRQDKPHVNYLIALTAGYFKGLTDQYKNIPMGFYTPVSLFDMAEASFKDTVDMMGFFEQETGIPYPWHQYNQAVVWDFVAGGMENTTLTILTHRTLHPEEMEPLESSTGLVAHELAHQWFGDYVTCKDWANLWLNEGFATYYENLYSGHQLGRNQFLYNQYNDAQGLLRRSDPQVPVFYRGYADADEQFDGRAYQKGGWVLHMLRSQLGDDLYRLCVKTYLERHALDTVETADLKVIIEELSGRSFDRFFDQWIYTGGHPRLNVSYEWSPSTKLAKITIEQTHARAQKDRDILFHVPATVRFHVAGEAVDHDVVIDQAQQEFYVALPGEPNQVRFDPNLTLLADITFKKSKAMLYTQLADNNDIIGQILAAKALQEKDDTQTVLQLKEALNLASFYGVRLVVTDALQKIHTDDAFDALAASLDQPDKRVRKRVISTIGQFYETEARDMLLAIARDESNSGLAAAAISNLGRYHDKDIPSILLNALKSRSFRDLRATAAVSSFNKLKDASYVPALIELAMTRQNDYPSREFGSVLSTLAQCAKNMDDTTDARETLLSLVNHPKQGIRIGAIRALGILGDEKAAAVLETLASKQRQVNGKTDPVQRDAQAALQQVRSNTPLAVPDEVVELRKNVKTLEEKNSKLEDKLDDLEARLDAMKDAD